MALKITYDCIACGACVEDCPHHAISFGPGIYVIDPKLCVECAGYNDSPQCAATCPVDACVPDPDNADTEDTITSKQETLAGAA